MKNHEEEEEEKAKITEGQYFQGYDALSCLLLSSFLLGSETSVDFISQDINLHVHHSNCF
jgi:hypothetical protein